MQDYNYVWGNCVEITLELSCCKYPHRYELANFWMQNKKPLLVYLAQVHRGVRGLVMDANGNLVSRATMKIKGRDVRFRSSKRGEYWRLLLPGTYTIGESWDSCLSLLTSSFSCPKNLTDTLLRLHLCGFTGAEIFADGYHPAEKTFTVNDGVITNLSIQLIPLGFVSREQEGDKLLSHRVTHAVADTDHKERTGDPEPDLNLHSPGFRVSS